MMVRPEDRWKQRLSRCHLHGRSAWCLNKCLHLSVSHRQEIKNKNCKSKNVNAQTGNLKNKQHFWSIFLFGPCLFWQLSLWKKKHDKKRCLRSKVFKSSQYHNLSLHGSHLSPYCQFHSVFYPCLSAWQQSKLQRRAWAWIWDKIKIMIKATLSLLSSDSMRPHFIPALSFVLWVLWFERHQTEHNCNDNYSMHCKVIHRCSNPFNIMLYQITHINYHIPQKSGKKD